jgi:hypothetical protein
MSESISDQMSSKRQKWERWLKEIRHQVYSAMESRLVYRQTSQIIWANDTLPKESAFYGRMQLWYAESSLMAVRRQTKIDPQAISLARLLNEIQREPSLINRAHYTGLYKGYATEHLAEGMFDRIAGAGSAAIDPARVAADLAKLQQVARSCETFADKRIAHFDRGNAPKPPTYQDLDDALDLIGELLQKYNSIVLAEDIAFTTPVIQHNWKKIFELAWAPRPPRKE